MSNSCSICTGEADSQFKRVQVWANNRWRLTTTTYSGVRGLCYLEPKRHVSYITELDGAEAAEFGTVLASVCRSLKSAAGAELVYVYIYGGHIPHLHVHLAPHTGGDVFFDDFVREGAVVSEARMSAEEVQQLSDEIRKGILL